MVTSGHESESLHQRIRSAWGSSFEFTAEFKHQIALMRRSFGH